MKRLTSLQLVSILESVVDQMEDGVLIVDAKANNRPIIFANQSFYRITGYRAEEVIGKNPRFLIGPGTNATVIKSIRDCITGKRNGSTTILNYKKDGTTFWNYLSIAPIHDEDGNISHWIGVERDVTAIIEKIQSTSKEQSMVTTIRTVNDIVNNFLNSVNFLREALENCAHEDGNYLDEFDNVYSKFITDFKKLNQVDSYKEKNSGDDFSLLDLS